MRISLSLDEDASEDVEVTYSTFGVSASNDGSDYTVFSSGTTKTITSSNSTEMIEIPIINDSELEGNETFIVTLSGVSGATFGPNVSKIFVVVTILDDETPLTLTVANTNVSASEGTSAQIGLRLNKSGTTTVTYSTSAITALNDGTDYEVKTDATQTITSSTTGIISIPIRDDGVEEGSESFAVTITEVSGAVFAEGINQIRIVVTITDPVIVLPVLTISTSETVGESDGNVSISATLDNPSSSAVTFRYSTTAGTATSLDYTSESSRLHTINPGATTPILIQISADEIDEQDEQFTVTYSSLTGATFAGGSAPTTTITITDDDQASFSIADSSVTEGDTGSVDMVFTVSLSNLSTRNTSVTWTASTEAGNSDIAIQGTDYAVATTTSTGTASIDAGSRSTTIRVPIAGDAINETNETFTVTLTSPTGDADLDDAVATGTIMDNDPDPVLTIATSVSVGESDTNTSISATLTGATEVPVSFNYSTVTGTASSADFTEQSSVLHTINPGATTPILVPITADEIDEVDEQFTVTYSSLSDATFVEMSHQQRQ